MCVCMVKNTHTEQNMHGNEKHQKLPQGKEGGEKNWEGIRKGFRILSNGSSQGRQGWREANMAPNTRFNKADGRNFLVSVCWNHFIIKGGKKCIKKMEIKVLLSVTNDGVLDFFLLFFSKLSLIDMYYFSNEKQTS